MEPHTLVITIEHADTGKMGGIGSYNAETDKLVNGIMFLLVDDDIDESPKSNIILCKNYITKHRPDLLGAYNSTLSNRSYVIYEITKDIVKEHPSISKISTHEYSGLSSAVATAAKLGFFPDITFRVHCHGGHLQLERATGVWEGVNIEVLDAERITIENADEVYFPARYLHDLYEAAGIKMLDSRVKYLGFPYEISRDLNDIEQYKEIENIVFIGRTNRLKGFDVFIDTVTQVVNTSPQALKRIIVIGKDDGSLADQRDTLKSLLRDKGIAYEQGLKTRQETLRAVTELSTNSVFLLPYYSDNFSVAMLEVVEAGAPLLVLDTGGNKDLIQTPSWTNCVAKNSKTFSIMTSELIRESPHDRGKKCVTLQRDFFTLQRSINSKNEKLYSGSVDKFTRQRSVKIAGHVQGVIRLIDTNSVDGPSISVLSGKYSGEALVDTYYYLIAPDAMELADEALDTLRQMLVCEAGSVYVCGYADSDGNVVMPQSTSIGTLGLQLSLRMSYVFLAQGKYISNFLKAYKNIPAGASEKERTFDDFVCGFMLMTVQQPELVQIVPFVIAKQVGTIRNWSFSEKDIFDIAHYLPYKHWNTFRHLVLVRYLLTQEAAKFTIIDDETDRFIAADSQSSRLMRALIRRQVQLLVSAKKTKRRLFP